MIIAACGFFAQCSSPSYEKNDYFSAFENRNDIKRLLAKANAGDSIAQAEVSMAYRDYAYSVLDKYLDEKEARHVYDQAFMKRMYWLEKAVEGGEVYAMDTLADF